MTAGFDHYGEMQQLGGRAIAHRKGNTGWRVERGSNWVEIWTCCKDGHSWYKFSAGWSRYLDWTSSLFLTAADLDVVLNFRPPDPSLSYWDRYNMFGWLEEHYIRAQEAASPCPEVLLLQSCAGLADEIHNEFGIDDPVWQLEWHGDMGDYSTVGQTAIGYVPWLTPYCRRTGWKVNMRWTTQPVTRADIEALAAVMAKREPGPADDGDQDEREPDPRERY